MKQILTIYPTDISAIHPISKDLGGVMRPLNNHRYLMSVTYLDYNST